MNPPPTHVAVSYTHTYGQKRVAGTLATTRAKLANACKLITGNKLSTVTLLNLNGNLLYDIITFKKIHVLKRHSKTCCFCIKHIVGLVMLCQKDSFTAEQLVGLFWPSNSFSHSTVVKLSGRFPWPLAVSSSLETKWAGFYGRLIWTLYLYLVVLVVDKTGLRRSI